jgi:hypothetical protein
MQLYLRATTVIKKVCLHARSTCKTPTQEGRTLVPCSLSLFIICQPLLHSFIAVVSSTKQLPLCLVKSSEKVNAFPHGPSRIVSMIRDFGSALLESLSSSGLVPIPLYECSVTYVCKHFYHFFSLEQLHYPCTETVEMLSLRSKVHRSWIGFQCIDHALRYCCRYVDRCECWGVRSGAVMMVSVVCSCEDDYSARKQSRQIEARKSILFN